MSYPFYQQPQFTPQVTPNYNANMYSPTYQQNIQRSPDERIWVQGEAGANAYLVAPNSFVRLWDSQRQVFYEKRADASGRPTTEIFEYSKKSEQQPIVTTAEDDFMSKLNALDTRISVLENMRKEENNVQKSNAKSILDDSAIQ